MKASFLSGVARDLQYALRALRNSPGFTVVSVLTLAICIGATTAVFTNIRSVLLNTPAYPEPDALVLLGETRPDTPGYSGAISQPNYLDWVNLNTVFERMAAVTGGSVTLSDGTREPIYVQGRNVSASYFDVLGIRAALGRTFRPEEDHPANNRVVVLSHRLWASHFGSDPSAIGRQVSLDGEPYVVIGVMPSGTGVDLLDPELWTPRDLGREAGDSSRGRRDLNKAVARLKEGATLEQARSQMNEIGRRLAERYPESNRGWGVSVRSWPRAVDQTFEQSLYLLFAAAVALFMIGCVNLANLALVRGVARSRELAIRLALGARRGELVRQLFVESLMIATAGCLTGLLLGYFFVSAITAVLPFTGVFKVVPSETIIAVDGSAWLFGCLICGIGSLAFGLVPALRSTQSLVAGSIRERGASTGLDSTRYRRNLVVAQVALAFGLLMISGLLIRSFASLQDHLIAGVDSPTNVLTAGIPIPSQRFHDPQGLNAYVARIREQVSLIPGVQDVAVSEGVPPEGTPFLRSFQIPNQPTRERARRPACGFNTVTPSYFRAIGLQILMGRSLTEADRRETPPVVVINETFARTYFAETNPVGQRLIMSGRSIGTGSPQEDESWEVVGVVENEGLSPWTRAPQALIYASREQVISDLVMLVVRARVNPISLQDSIHKTISSLEPEQAVANVRLLDDQKTDYVASDRLRSLVCSLFAAIAMALAALGLYGVLAYTVVQRQHELAIRSAIGASPANVMTIVMQEGMQMTSYGLALGIGGTFLVARVMTSVLFGIQPFDVVTLVAVTILVCGTALVACLIPARRAARIHPLAALRNE